MNNKTATASPASRPAEPKADLLIVDDKPANLRLLAAMLTDGDADTRPRDR